MPTQEILFLNKPKKKYTYLNLKAVFTLLALSFFLTSCFFNNLAPKNIREYEIAFLSKKVDSFNEEYLNKVDRYVFNKNGTYISYFEGKIDSAGDYSYRRKGKNKAQIVLSYNDNYGINNYMIELTFINEKSGSWEGSGHQDAVNSQGGTFTVLQGHLKK